MLEKNFFEEKKIFNQKHRSIYTKMCIIKFQETFRMNIVVADLFKKDIWEKPHVLRNTKVWGLLIKKWRDKSEG